MMFSEFNGEQDVDRLRLLFIDNKPSFDKGA